MSNEVNNNLGNSQSDMDLQRIYKILFRRKRLLFSIFSAIFFFSSVYLITKRVLFSTYEGYFILLVKDPLRERSSNKDEIFIEEVLNSRYDVDVYTLKEVLKSSNNLKEIAVKYNLKPSKLSNKIEIKELRQNKDESSGILKISLFTNRPKKDFLLLSDLSRYFLNNSRSQIKINLQKGIDFINQKEPKLIAAREKLQEELVQFRESKSVIIPEDETISIKEQVKILRKEINSISAIQSQLKNIKKEVISENITAREFSDNIGATSKNFNSGINVSLNANDQKYLDELLKLEEELVESQFIFKPNSIYIKSLKNKINDLKPKIKIIQTKSINNAIQLNDSIIKSKIKQQKNFQNEFLSKPRQIKKYNNIISNLDLAKQNIEQLNRAREIILLKSAQTNLPWLILQDPKMSSKPFSPKLRRGFLLILFLSTIISLLLAILRDRIENVFHDNQEIKDELGLSVIGGLPYIKFFSSLNNTYLEFVNSFEENSQVNKKFDNKFFDYLQKSLNNIFISIKYKKREENFQSISITSSVKNEGKSLITLLLAKTILDLDEKVLIIDCDLRNPKISKVLKLQKNYGFANLTEKEQDLNKYILKHPESGIDILPAGNKKVNPMKVLNNDKLKNILKILQEKYSYDYVLVDCGSLELPETSLSICHTNKNLLIVSLYNVNKNKCKELINNQELNNKTLGVISNLLLQKKENMNLEKYSPYYDKDEEYPDPKKRQTNEDEENYKFKLLKTIKRLFDAVYKWIDE